MDSYYSNEELNLFGFRKFGDNVRISKKCSVYMPENISIGSNVRIDDFCIIVGGEEGIQIGSYVHIAIYCAIFGHGGVFLDDFSGLSSRVVLYSATDDYSGEFLTNPTVPKEYQNVVQGKIILNKHVIIGTNSTILPDVVIGEGSAVGAHSLVSRSLKPWGIYFGSPARKIKDRNKKLLELEQQVYTKFARGES